MIATAMPAEREHPAAEVVVDVLQEHRRAGGDDGRVLEGRACRPAPARGRRPCPRSRSTRCRVSRVDDLRMRRVEDERAVREPDVALVVVDEEVHPLGVVERALVDRDRVEALERRARVLDARATCSGDPGCLLRQRGLQRAARDARRRIAAVALHERVGELDDRERCDHAVQRVRCRSTRRGTAGAGPRFSAVNSSSTVWPSSIVMTVSIAWPPKRSW